MFRLVILLVLPLLAIAQLTPNSITVSASRDAAPQADQVQFNLSIEAGVDASQEEVLAAIAGAGVTAAGFAGIYSNYYPNNERPVQWTFTLTAKLANLKSTIGLLTAMQKSLDKEGRFALQFAIQGTQVSDQARQAQGCAVADLVADARAQAVKLAGGAGMNVGAVQAISGSVNVVGASGSGSLGGVAVVSSPACFITVKFALTGAGF